MKRHSGCVAGVIVLLLISGCSSSRLSVFPDFPDQKARLGGAVILADFLLLKATHLDTPVVDLAANKNTADRLLGYAEGELSRKGYNVTGRILSSVGLLMERERGANVARTSELDPEEGGGTLYLHPPFYLYQALRRDTVLKELFESVYRKLVSTGDDPALLPVVEEIIPLGKVLGGGMIFIFLGGGFEIPAGVAIASGQTHLSGESTHIAYQSISQASLHLYVLNSVTGEIIWTDHQVKKGGVNYDEKYVSMAENLLEDLP